MKKYAVLMILATVLAVSCKKKDATPASGTGTTSGQVNGFTYGTMETIIIQSYFGQTFGGTDSLVVANFSSGAPGSSQGVSAGTVKFNNTILKFDQSYQQYQDTTHILNIHGTNVWNVSGSANVPAITFSFNPVYPVFMGNAQLPDSVSRASGFTVNIAGAANIANNSVTVELYTSGGGVSKQIPPNQTSCTFSHNDLASLQNDPNAMLIIVFGNVTTQVFGGREYAFGASLEHIKYNVKVKP